MEQKSQLEVSVTEIADGASAAKEARGFMERLLSVLSQRLPLLDRAVKILNALFVVVLFGNLGLDLWAIATAHNTSDILVAAAKAVEFLMLTAFVLIFPARLERHGHGDVANWIRRLTTAYAVVAISWVVASSGFAVSDSLQAILHVLPNAASFR